MVCNLCGLSYPLLALGHDSHSLFSSPLPFSHSLCTGGGGDSGVELAVVSYFVV
jgi:hypothetical protein